MHKHHGRHNDPSHHAHILMYGSSAHHAGGGMTGSALGNMATNTSSYKKGGHPHRRRHAEGDMAGKNPITGSTSPDIIAKSRGGRACHAAGDTVAVPYRRGGKPHHHRRRHHAKGEMAEMERGDHADGGSAALLRHGGGAHHHKRHHHAKGEMAEMMARGGPKKKRTVGT